MPAAPGPPLLVIGVGADGWEGLSAARQREVLDAEVVLGSPRLLLSLPDAVLTSAVTEPWPSPLRDGLPSLLERYAGRRVVALASGDPLVSGVGTTIVGLLGADRVVVHPAVSSVALARARMGWSAESCTTVSLVGRDEHLLLRHLAPSVRLLLLDSDETVPARVAAMLAVAHGDSELTVLGDLGSADESRISGTAAGWSVDAPVVPRLHVLAVEVSGNATPGTSWVAGLPDSAFEHDGQLTKRDLRASALARLAPAPGQVLWDVGAGAGSIGIEWMRAHPTCRAVAVEQDADRAARIGRNAAALGVPGLEVVVGTVPAALAGLEQPDAVFVGGGATRPGVIDTCLGALPPGGRLVVHGVTLETERLLAERYVDLGGELTRLSVETAEPIGSFTGWTPARTVTQWTLVR